MKMKKDNIVVALGLLIVAGGIISYFVGEVFGIFDWLSNNFDAFFEVYVGMGIWFHVIVIGFIVAYIWFLQPWNWFRKNKKPCS